MKNNNNQDSITSCDQAAITPRALPQATTNYWKDTPIDARFGLFSVKTTGFPMFAAVLFIGCMAWFAFAVVLKTTVSVLAQIFSQFLQNKSKQPDKLPEPSPSPDEPQMGCKEGHNLWADTFHKSHPMPVTPPFIKRILDGCPEGYEDAMLFALLTELGALCFSKVRARYLDGVKHTPSLLLVIEAAFGSGKGKFETAYQILFERLIKLDQAKLANEVFPNIIQNMGINTSRSKFYDVTANNQGVHQCIVESEISAATDVLKKPNGLSYEHLRKAFENGPVFQNNKAKDSATGLYPVFLNAVFTGTPDAVGKFIGKEIEGGTASRFIWSTFPESGRDIATLYLPQGEELEQMRNQIEDWHDRYCYHTQGNQDIVSKETEINLDYVSVSLKQWLNFQYDRYVQDGNSARKDIRSRAAAIAFHCSIVLHMLWGQPKEEDSVSRKSVVDLTIYIADYCVERFIQKFGALHNLQREANRSAEYVTPQGSTGHSSVKIKGVPLDVALKMKQYYQKGVDGHGLKSTLDIYGKPYGLKQANQVSRILEELEKRGY